ncbi:MAG: dual specificity protein phosphatase [Thermodesulfobacteriota bacterium]
MSAQAPAYPLTWVTDGLAVGGAPMSFDQLDSLREQGVTAIMNLCAEFCDLHSIEAKHGFEVYYLPVHDEEAPELAELERGLAWLDEAIYLGKKVLIHCRHGIGRTGTVLNAYLLRRGLGHKLAGRKLKRLRSKPANFAQWRTIRRYGKAAGRLTVREPSLEFRRLVDLSPYFAEYQALVERTEDLFGLEALERDRCGRDHDRCCRIPVGLSLAEAVVLTHALNTTLESEKRLSIIAAAVDAALRERRTTAAQPADEADFCLTDADSACPLLERGRCLLFARRPLQCRSDGLPEDTKAELWDELLGPALARLSQQIFFAYTSAFLPRRMPAFKLPDVVSGRYVQTFFHLLMESGMGPVPGRAS